MDDIALDNDAHQSAQDLDIQKLERQVEALLGKLESLSVENKSLRFQQAGLLKERTALIDKTELARSRIEAMIARLKSME